MPFVFRPSSIVLAGRSPVARNGWATWREAFFIGALFTAWSLLFRGFDGGRWSDIPIIKSFVDPRLYALDPFISTLHSGTPAAYTYRFIAAVVGMLPGLPIEWTLFLLYVPASLASLSLLYLIGLHLVRDRVSVLLFLFLYVAGFRLVTIGSTILHSAELTPAFLALPLQLGALYALLCRKHVLVGASTGLALDVHAPTSSYVAGAIGLVYVLSARRFGFRNLAAAGLFAALCGLPAIVGAITRHTDPLPGWALQLARLELATDLSVAINWDRAALRLRNIFGLAVVVVAMLTVPSFDRSIVLRIFLAVAAMCFIAFLFIDVSLRGEVSTLVARLQFPRSAWLVNLFGLIYVAHYLQHSWRVERLPRITILTLAAAMLASPSDLSPLEPLWLCAVAFLMAAELAARALPPERRRVAFTAISVLTLAAAVGLAGARLFGRRAWVFDFDYALKAAAMTAALLVGWLLIRQLRAPLGQRAALGTGLATAFIGAFLIRGSTEWLFEQRHRGGLAAAAEFQEWARTETSVDSVFLILPSEPNNETFYKNAERPLYLMRERANQAVYFREHNFEFRDRVLALGVSDVLRYREELDPSYRRLTEERVRDLAARYSVTHFVPARTGEFTFPIVYQKGGWMVYQVRSRESGDRSEKFGASGAEASALPPSEHARLNNPAGY